jgi:large subunit ribosomal protein L10
MVAELQQALTDRSHIFVASVSGLRAAETDSFRQKLHAFEARLLMVKRTLARRTIDGLDHAGLAEALEGSVGLILARGDALATAKLLFDFRKSREAQLSLRAAVVDGQFLDAARVEQFAKLPPKPQLLAELVNAIESPIVDVVSTIERLIGDLMYAIEQLGNQRPAAAPAGATPAAPTAPSETAAEPAPPAAGPA